LHERPRIPLRRRIRLRSSWGAAAASLPVLGTSLLLAGCAAASAPAPTPAPAPSLTQEQQDDAAFRAVFTRYVDLDANTDTEQDLADLLTGNVLDDEKSGLVDERQSGERQVGKATASGFEVTDRGTDPAGHQYMTAQACLDSSGARLLDRDGKDMTPQRDTRLSLQLKAVRSEDAHWRISDIVRNEDVRACG
jgi:hypothetical protein